MAVLFAHIFQIWTWQPATKALFPLGHTGVVVFFALSGFLITRLLLTEPQENSLGASFKNFYIRRCLRIFPIYYLYLVVTYSWNIDDIREAGAYPWWHLGNQFMFNENSWLSSHSHLWSLSVEEQFYLVWPFLILFLRRHSKALYGVLSGVMLVAVLSRLLLFTSGYSEGGPRITVFTPACLDFLAAGGVLALLHLQYGERIKPFGLPCLLLSVFAYYLCYTLKELYGLDWLFWSVGQFAVATASVGVVAMALTTPPSQGVFHNPLTIHLGKVSYGIYLYHNVIVEHYAGIADAVGIDAGESLVLKIILSVLFTMIITELSFALIERPVLRLKERFR